MANLSLHPSFWQVLQQRHKTGSDKNKRIDSCSSHPGDSVVAQTVNRLSTMQETQVRSLGWEDPLEKEMAVHSSTIAWKIPWTEEPGRLQSMGSQRVGHDRATSCSRSAKAQQQQKESFFQEREA